MYGGNRNSGISSMKTYAQALDWFDKSIPIRGKGRNGGIKPLGHRGKPHHQILKGENDEIVCKCYQTNVVTYMPDGRIKLDSGGYMSQTTAGFMEEVLGVGVSIRDHDLVLSMYGNAYRVGSGLELRYVNDRYVVDKAAKFYTHTVNRKVMNSLRKEIEPFIKYVKGSIKIRGREGFSEEEKLNTLAALGYSGLELNPAGHWGEDKSVTYSKVCRFLDMARSEDMENWYVASCWLAWSHSTWTRSILVTEQTVMGYINDLLIATNKDAVTKTEVPEGEVKRDRYAAITKLMEEE